VWKSEIIPQPPAERAWERIGIQMKVILADDPDLLEDLESLAPVEKGI
jgi:hypothetical protein